MQRGSRLSEDEMAGVISGAAQLYRREQGVKVVEVSIRVSSKENEANICGDLGGQIEKLWDVFEINGVPQEDNPYIFNGDIIRGGRDMQLATALFALKIMQPSAVHILTSSHNQMESSQPMGVLLNMLPLGAMLNREVMILHSTLFADGCRRILPPNVSPRRQYQQFPALLPEPTADPNDPVFLQQLKGLEAGSDTTVATIRVTQQGILLPDNARFMMFQIKRQFSCMAYFGGEAEQEEERWAERATTRQPSSSYQRQPSSQYEKPKASQPSSQYEKPKASQPSSQYEKPKASQPSSQHEKPKAPHSSGSGGNSKQSQSSHPQSSYTKHAPASGSKSSAASAASAKLKVPSLNLSALNKDKDSAQPPSNARARGSESAREHAGQSSMKAPSNSSHSTHGSQHAPSGSVTSRRYVESVAARYAEEYLRGATKSGTTPNHSTYNSGATTARTYTGSSYAQSSAGKYSTRTSSLKPPGAGGGSRWK